MVNSSFVTKLFFWGWDWGRGEGEGAGAGERGDVPSTTISTSSGSGTEQLGELTNKKS